MQQEEDDTSSSAVSFCPSFNAYTPDKLVDIAARVSQEFKAEKSTSEALLEQVDEENDDRDDFEFVCVGKNLDASELFFDGEIHQVFPVFNRDLLLNDGDYSRYMNPEIEQTQLKERVCPLEKLFVDDGQAGPPSISSPDSIFCVWSPSKNSIESLPNRCKKSNSTGSSSSPSSSSSSSKKWLKLRNLLKKSNSDGKDSSFVFLSKPKPNTGKERKNSKEVKSGKAVPAHEAFYVKTRANKEGDKKRSYLPNRQDLVGLFASYLCSDKSNKIDRDIINLL